MKIETSNKTTTKTVRTLTTVLTLALAIGASPALQAHSEAIRITECRRPPITEANSFVLANNLISPGNEDCLRIETEFVTIDDVGGLVRDKDGIIKTRAQRRGRPNAVCGRQIRLGQWICCIRRYRGNVIFDKGGRANYSLSYLRLGRRSGKNCYLSAAGDRRQ